MFTGLVTATGNVVSLTPAGDGMRLALQSSLFDENISLGESIAVNGVCLTVVNVQADVVTFELAPETLRKTTLAALQDRAAVNLERALRLSDRLGGHWVQGHVDGVGTLL